MKGGATMDYTVIKELLREAIDPVVLMEYYGIDISDRSFRYDKIRCRCPLHDGDNPSAFSFDLNSKTFTCFTNHCGDNFQGRDIFIFIKMMEEKRNNRTCSFSQVLKICSQLTGIPVDESTSAYNKDMIDKLDNQKWTRQMARIGYSVELECFNEEEIEIYKAQLPLCDYILSRKFEGYVLDHFEIGFSLDGIDESYNANKKDFPGRVIFPVRDTKGSLVGWSGRIATDDKVIIKKYNKWMHKLDFDKGMVLYNYNHAKDFVRDTKELILVEGPFDVKRLWSYGIFNVAAVLGSSLTPEQLMLAITSAIKVKVFLDADGAGQSGARRICEQLRKYVDVYTINAPDGKDPDQLNFDEAWDSVLNAKRYVPSPNEKKR